MKVTLGIIIGLLVIMCGLCVFSDPVEYKRSNVKLYLFEDFSGDGGGKSHPSVIFHKFKDSTGNVYNIQALETPDYISLKYGDSVIAKYSFKAGRAIRHDSIIEFITYNKIK